MNAMDSSRPARRTLRLAFLIFLTALVPMTSATLSAQTILVARDATWKYLDDGSNQGADWRALEFDDSSWSEGPAELGYGDAGFPDFRPEATMLSYGTDPNNKPITYYFRHWFNVEIPSRVTNLVALLLRDDGAVVYLNGAEVVRSNMPAGVITYQTRASPPGVASGPEEYTYYPSLIDPGLLLAGQNLIAVEIHQVAPTSSDISFALELRAEIGEPPSLPPVSLVRGPYLQLCTTTNATVCWRTDIATNSLVRFGSSATALAWQANDPTMSTEHFATLINLSPDTKYYYSIGANGTNLAGGIDFYFRTMPIGPKPTRIWAIGDAGTASAGSYGSLLVRDSYAAYAGSRETDVWLMLGDNAYYDGFDELYQTAVFEVYPHMLRRWPLWSTIGNHEVPPAWHPAFDYLSIFAFPQNGEAGGIASGTERYYSFNYGNIHFVCLDSESSSHAPGAPMWTWLEQDLAANSKDWLIAFWHSPPFSHGTHNSDDPTDTGGHLVEMREQAVPILESYGVDLVLCGHSHDYQRTYLLDGHYGYESSLTPTMIKDSGSGRIAETGAYFKSGTGPSRHEGAVYVVCGSSGWVTPSISGLRQHRAVFVQLRQLGSMVIDIDGNRLDAKFLRETGVIGDQFTILKGQAPEPLRVVTFQKNGNSTILRWKSIAGRTYQVEAAFDVASHTWQSVSGVIPATGATTSRTNTTGSVLPAGFYRVVQLGQ